MMPNNNFLIVVDTNVVKDSCEYSIRTPRDSVDRDNLSHANSFFTQIHDNVLLCFDCEEQDSRILNEYKEEIGEQNIIRFMIRFYQKIYYFPENNIRKLNSHQKKELLQSGFDRTDIIFVNVANSIENEKYIITRDSHFYEPGNPSLIGRSDTTISRLLKRKYNILAKLPRDAISVNDICR
jgi:hypothetical protein